MSVNFQDYFPLPFTSMYSKVFSSTSMVFDFAFKSSMFSNPLVISQETKDKIVRIINGSNEKMSTNFQLFYNDGIIQIKIENEPLKELILIRGWGYLTGKGGGLGLDEEKAVEIQKLTANFIIDKLLSAQLSGA